LQRNGKYPLGSRGNIVIDRQIKTGYITRIAWCLSDDGQSWIMLTPNNERTIVDYVVAGSFVRGNYRISSLIYVFLANPFMYLYDMTKAGIDWTPIMGSSSASGGAADLATNLASAHPDSSGLALMRSATDSSRVADYLGLVGADASVQLTEEVAPMGSQILALDGGMPVRLIPARPYRPDRGLPVESAAAVMVDGAASGNVYIGILDGGAGSQPLKLAMVPFEDESGAYRIVTVDAVKRQTVDLSTLMSQRAGSWIRLFGLPGPARQP
jgi:hypothetical protein